MLPFQAVEASSYSKPRSEQQVGAARPLAEPRRVERLASADCDLHPASGSARFPPAARGRHESLRVQCHGRPIPPARPEPSTQGPGCGRERLTLSTVACDIATGEAGLVATADRAAKPDNTARHDQRTP